jgi:hypothetical protein
LGLIAVPERLVAAKLRLRKECDMTDNGPQLGGGKRLRPPRDTDRLRIETRKGERPPTEIESRVLEALEEMHFTDERGEARYQERIQTLRERPDEVRGAVEQLADSSPDDHHFQWNLYHTVAALELPELASLFVNRAARDLPEITDTTPCESVDEDKILVAIMAVEGLEGIARKEPDTAIGALTQVVERQPNVAVRSSAVQAILRLRPEASEDVARLLPDDQRFLLDVERMPVHQLTAAPERARSGRSAPRSPRLPSDRNIPQGRTE